MRIVMAFLLASLLSGQIIFHQRPSVPRLRYAIELRDELQKRGRLCDHAEDWHAALIAIAEGAELIEMAVCHHDRKTRRTSYRVTARWLTEREYPQASVLEGRDKR